LDVGTDVVAISLSVKELEAGVQRATVIARLAKLPPFHPAAVKLLALSADSDPAMTDFERAFGADPALASDLLVLANSALYGLRTRVDNLRHAIALLGLDTVRSLTLTVALGAYVRSGQSRKVVQSVWAHSLATAHIAEAIGRAQGEPGPSLYTAGLVHDIGRLGMLNLEGDRYAGILQGSYAGMDESLLLETLIFGCAHDEAGAFLARSWGFPETICECVEMHHQAVAGKKQTLRVVQLACRYANALGFGELNCADRPEAALDVLPPALRGIAPLEPARMHKRIAQAEAEFCSLSTAIPVGARLLPPAASFRMV
jgi:putative nucleotidyltransferase with HDIG domain